jgi:hypothetical protein
MNALDDFTLSLPAVEHVRRPDNADRDMVADNRRAEPVRIDMAFDSYKVCHILSGQY